LNIDVDAVAKAITPKTRALMVVHLLGNPCDMGRLMDIARQHRLWVVEDCCEAHGASVQGQRVGTFGDLSTFSFFFSHHMTSIEGGVIGGHHRQRWHDLLISMRAHGWIRGRSDHDAWVRSYPDIDPRWLFVTPGYNLRPTEINAAFAQIQLRKLPLFVEQRHGIRTRILERLEPYQKFFRFQRHLDHHLHSTFGISLILRDGVPFSRKQFQDYLEAKGIQTRPIVGSNLARQPVMHHLPHRISGPLANADMVHYRGLMIGNHHNVTRLQEDFLIDVVESFIKMNG
jgi:CDP-4-dehydro-6-deoxyglucose reductase, E1